VILINLLPHREERRKRRKAAFFAGLMLSGLAALGAGGVWYLVVQQMVSTQQDRNTFLKTEIGKLEEQIKDIASLRNQIDSLKARQKAVEDLQVDRNIPVHILNELVRQTPEGIYFTSIKQDSQNLTVTGYAQSNERVSEFLRNTSKNSNWLMRPELIEIKVSNASQASRELRRLSEFSVRISVRRPQDQAASAPDAAASSPKAIAAPKV
jgi:type IV pilus assembly protein PilN